MNNFSRVGADTQRQNESPGVKLSQDEAQPECLPNGAGAFSKVDATATSQPEANHVRLSRPDSNGRPAKVKRMSVDNFSRVQAALQKRIAANQAKAAAQMQEQQQGLFPGASQVQFQLSPSEAALPAPAATTSDASPAKATRERPALLPARHVERDFFLCDVFDYALKDDGVSMEAPIFTLSTKPDLSVWHWKSKDGNREVTVTPSVQGRATQFDKDVLIYVVSQMTEALNRDRPDAKNRTVRFTVYDYLVSTNKPTGGVQYHRIESALERLRGTSIKTNIKTGGHRVKEGFGLINRWKIVEKSPDDERMIAVEVELSEWLFNAVQAHEVLTLHPHYFRLRKPLERRLYELARKHCGYQSTWSIGLELLQEKAGSKGSVREFRRMVRSIADADALPDYRLILGADDKVVFYTKDMKRLNASIGVSSFSVQ